MPPHTLELSRDLARCISPEGVQNRPTNPSTRSSLGLSPRRTNPLSSNASKVSPRRPAAPRLEGYALGGERAIAGPGDRASDSPLRDATRAGGSRPGRRRPRAHNVALRGRLDTLGRGRRRQQRRLLPGGAGGYRRIRGQGGACRAAVGGRRGAPRDGRGKSRMTTRRTATAPRHKQPLHAPDSTNRLFGASVGGGTGDDD